MRSIFIFALLIYCFPAFSKVLITGLEVGETNLQEAESRYVIRKVGVNSTARVSIYELGLLQLDDKNHCAMERDFVSLDFNEADILVSVETSFKGNTYQQIRDELSIKYNAAKMTEAEARFFGEFAAKYVDGLVSIIVFYIDSENQTRLTFYLT